MLLVLSSGICYSLSRALGIVCYLRFKSEQFSRELKNKSEQRYEYNRIMGKHLHKRFVDDQVKDIVTKYIEKQLRGKEACRYLGIGRTRLHQLIKEYQAHPGEPVIGYTRTVPTRQVKQSIKEHILKELSFEKEKIIDNPNVPTKRYNYSYIKNLMQEKYDEQVSLPTIITVAKAN